MSMKKTAIALATSVAFMSTGANAFIGKIEAGKKTVNVEFGLGTESTGIALSGNWLKVKDKAELGSLGLGLNIPLGPLLLNAGGKILYLNARDGGGKDGASAAIGGGVRWDINDSWIVAANAFYSPKGLTYGMKDYKEANAYVRWNVFRPLSVHAGYRYMETAARDGDENTRSVKMFNGPYVGAAISF